MADPTVGVLYGPSEYKTLLRGDTMRFRFTAYDRIDGVLRPMDLTAFDDGVFMSVIDSRTASTALYVFTLTVLTDPADLVTDPVSGSDVAAKCEITDAYFDPAKATEGNVLCRVFGKSSLTVKTIGKFWEAGLWNTGAIAE